MTGKVVQTAMEDGKTRTHKDLLVWQRAMGLVEHVYRLTASFPKEELYGLSSQARRAAVSIPSNIAEGAARQSEREYQQSLYIALGSLAELETPMLVATRLLYCTLAQSTAIRASLADIRRLLCGLIQHLKRTP